MQSKIIVNLQGDAETNYAAGIAGFIARCVKVINSLHEKTN